MANNFLQPGRLDTFTAPTGGVTTGIPVLIGTMFVVPLVTALAGATFTGEVVGVWNLVKNTGETWLEGQAVYFDVANARMTNDSTSGGLPIGCVNAPAAASADVLGAVRLNGVALGGRVIEFRKRLTIAQVNAGTTLVAAIPGVKFRLIEASAIAVGGAVTSVTTVDILGILSASSRKLVAFAQASLTQSAQLKSGGAGAAILADGASFTLNDVNTAITANITGSAITVATHIDFDLKFALE